MKIDEKIIRELKRAVAASGGASRFADACGIDAANISRYLNGKVHSISDDNWQKLRPHLAVSEAVSARTDGVIANTAELREFIKDAMMRNGLTSAAELTRRIGYDQPDTISRLLAGKLDWFPEVLSQVFATLGIDYDAAPLTRTERELLLPREMFAAGAQLVRPIPVVSWANAASHLAMLGAGETTCRDWNPESTETVLMPIGGRQDTVAFRISGVSMEPALQDNDVILVEPAESLDEIGNKRIVVVHLSESSGCSDEVYCKRFFRIGKKIELRSDNPAGRNLTIVPADIRWIGVAVRKLSEL